MSSRSIDLKDGAVAQLVERHNGIVEVGGSTPLGSTKLRRSIPDT